MSTADDLRDMSAHLRAHPEANLRDEFDTLLWLLIEAFSKSADDLAEAGRNDTTVVRDGGDRAGKGSTARSLPPLAGADASDVSVEGRSEIGPQKGVQSLGDDLREFAVGLAGGTWVPGHAARVAEGFADRAEVVEGERDRLDADIAIMRDADLTATDVQRRRAETAEAAVARVRKALPELLAIYRATGAAGPVVAVLEAARVLVDDTLDGSGLSLDTAVEVDR